MRPDRHNPETHGRRPRPAFTLVEMLVVLVILVTLVSAVLVGSSAILDRARTKQTQFALQIVRDAVEEFKREQTANATLTRARQDVTGGTPVRYEDRYGKYPPDELELFTKAGLPGSYPAGGSLAVGHSATTPVVVVPVPATGGYPTMEFGPTAQPEYQHRDIAALVLTIDMFGDSSSLILGKLPESYRVPGPVDAAGEPMQFLDRDDNEKWDPESDQEIQHLVDGWGTPLNYFAQRDWDPATATATASDNATDWNELSTRMIRANGGQPVIVSYGPDGPDQFSKDVLDAEPSASLLSDLKDDNNRADNPLNKDNVYADPALREKLFQGIPEVPE